jgi:hypothetical protein
MVCVGCGLVLADDAYRIDVSTPAHGQTVSWHKASSYKYIFHWNERMAQLNCTDPDIPEAFWVCILRGWTMYGYQWRGGRLNKNRIRKLLELVDSSPWCKNHLKKLGPKKANISLKKKYLERWVTIIYRLTGIRPPPMTSEFIVEMEKRLFMLCYHFQFVRHAEECDGNGWKCHHKYACRHNLPNYNFMMRQFILDIYHSDKVKWAWIKKYLRYLPTLKTESRKRKLIEIWNKLTPYTNMPLRGIK